MKACLRFVFLSLITLTVEGRVGSPTGSKRAETLRAFPKIESEDFDQKWQDEWDELDAAIAEHRRKWKKLEEAELNGEGGVSLESMREEWKEVKSIAETLREEREELEAEIARHNQEKLDFEERQREEKQNFEKNQARERKEYLAKQQAQKWWTQRETHKNTHE